MPIVCNVQSSIYEKLQMIINKCLTDIIRERPSIEVVIQLLQAI